MCSESVPYNFKGGKLTIKLLRTLVAVADHKTFSAAADAVHITHAAVSQQMRTLEADLGVTLFNRRTRTPELTPLGLRIVEKSKKLLSDYDNLVPSVLADGGLSGQLSFGALRTTLTGLTPQALSLLKSKFPDVSWRIRPGLTGTLLADVERGALDVALVTKPLLMPIGMVFKEVTVEPMRLIAALDEPEDDPLILLSERPFIRFNRNAVVGTLIDNWILSKRIRVQETMELDSPEAIASMVQAKLGVSIIPDAAVKPPDSLPVKSINLGEDAPTRVLGLVYHKDQTKLKAVEEIYAALRSVIDAQAEASC